MGDGLLDAVWLRGDGSVRVWGVCGGDDFVVAGVGTGDVLRRGGAAR